MRFAIPLRVVTAILTVDTGSYLGLRIAAVEGVATSVRIDCWTYSVVSLCSERLQSSRESRAGPLFLASDGKRLWPKKRTGFAISVLVEAWIHDERALHSREFHEST